VRNKKLKPNLFPIGSGIFNIGNNEWMLYFSFKLTNIVEKGEVK